MWRRVRSHMPVLFRPCLYTEHNEGWISMVCRQMVYSSGCLQIRQYSFPRLDITVYVHDMNIMQYHFFLSNIPFHIQYTQILNALNPHLNLLLRCGLGPVDVTNVHHGNFIVTDCPSANESRENVERDCINSLGTLNIITTKICSYFMGHSVDDRKVPCRIHVS